MVVHGSFVDPPTKRQVYDKLMKNQYVSLKLPFKSRYLNQNVSIVFVFFPTYFLLPALLSSIRSLLHFFFNMSWGWNTIDSDAVCMWSCCFANSYAN